MLSIHVYDEIVHYGQRMLIYDLRLMASEKHRLF